MDKQSVTHNTFVIERNYRHAPERVFAAFADAAKKRRWFGEGENHEIVEFAMDFRVGGIERAEYRLNEKTPFPGVALTHDGSYADIVPDRRVVTASTMAFGGRRISASLVTIELVATEDGTKLICTHQGAFFEGSDGPAMRKAGWEKLMDRLTAELEAA
jgi:uncharacterized protein YndB with AHSA1/START domain